MNKDKKLLVLDCFGLFAGDPFVTYFLRHFGKESMPIKNKYCEPADKGLITFEELMDGIERELHVDRVEMMKELREIGKPIPEMMAWAKKMKEKHQVVLLSNCMDRMMNIIFDGTEFFSCFDETYLSYKLGLVKPYEAIYKKLLDEHKEYEMSLFIDDNPANLVEAERLGMKTILYTGFNDMVKKAEALGY
ncbi:MAG: HAD-IA family hydrolase [Bacilli bacterium]|nr:HAD-IA family hydrolase [Bacilli bacterium]